MAQESLRHRRGLLSRLAGVFLAVFGVGACATSRGFGMALVFESRSTTLLVDKFDWPNRVSKRGLIAGAMVLSPRSPAEMSFMAEELKGIPEWIDLAWRSPIDEIRTGPRPNDFRVDFTRTKRHEQRVYPKAVVPASVVEELRASRGKIVKILKLHFVFDDAKAWVEYEVYAWHRRSSD